MPVMPKLHCPLWAWRSFPSKTKEKKTILFILNKISLSILNRFFKYITLFLVFFSSQPFYFAQNRVLDSLYIALKSSSSDSSRIFIKYQIGENAGIFRAGYWDSLSKEANALSKKFDDLRLKKTESMAINNLGVVIYSQGNPQLSFKYYEQSIKIMEELLLQEMTEAAQKDIQENLANSLNNIGSSYDNQGETHKAKEYYERSLKLYEKTGNKKGIATAYNNIGLLEYNQGNIAAALEHFHKSLKIREGLNAPSDVANSLNNIGLVYSTQGDHTTALGYYLKSLNLYQKTSNKEGVAWATNNVGNVYKILGRFDKALDYFTSALKLQSEIGSKTGLGSTYNYIGSLYDEFEGPEKALEYYFKSLRIREDVGNKQGVAESLRNLSGCYVKLAKKAKEQMLTQKYLRLALSYGDSSLFLARVLQYPQNLRDAEKALYNIYALDKNYKEAFDHYKQYILFRDSVMNESTRKTSIKNQLKYEYEKKEAVIKEQQDKERAVAEEKSRFQQIVIGSVILGLILVLIFSAFIFRSLRLTNKQKHIIEQKQNEILDSIHYAKKIQSAVMTSEKYVERELNRLKES
jgi:tetratricopeptide (TPR) repeat protein